LSGAQLTLQHRDATQKQPKAKCPFTPQRELVSKIWGSSPPGQPVQGRLF